MTVTTMKQRPQPRARRWPDDGRPGPGRSPPGPTTVKTLKSRRRPRAAPTPAGLSLAVFAALVLSLWPLRVDALCLAPLCSCTVATTAVVFSNYNPFSSSNIDNSGNIAVTCAGVLGLAIPLNIALSAGTGATPGNRVLASGSRRLRYNLYTDSSRTVVWGDGAGGTGLPTGNVGLDLLGLSPPVNFPVYGRIFGAQTTVAPGVYQDSLVVTVTYF
jgi:spore coat protein U-like protein